MELRLTCLGNFQIKRGGEPFTAIPTDKVRALLVYLAVEERVYARSDLVQLLWPGYSAESANNSLRQALHRLRHLLQDDEEDTPWLLITRQTVQINPDAPISVDVTTFLQLLADCSAHAHTQLAACPACLARLEQAVDLYQGDFLAGFTVADSDEFEEWRRVTQEQLHIQALDALARLADAAESNGDAEGALRALQRQLTLEPWLETAHRQVMRLQAQRGQRAAALAQYQRCRQVLAEELGVEPDAETTALYEQIQRGSFEQKTGRQGEAESKSSALSPPPLVSLPPSLPVFPTPLVGRTQALAEIGAYLLQPGVRLLTLIGPGGMGKTRLAVEVGQERLAAYPDGIWFVSLAPITTPAALGAVIADALGITIQGDPRHTLLQSLRHKQLLLILDNFEHLLAGGDRGAVDLVVDLLNAAPQIQILVTSRERLKLRGEQVYDVQALTFATLATLAEAAALAAVRLFVQSLQQAQPNFQLTAANLPAVLRICQLVQGMPLGLELAAANAYGAPLNAIADAIEQSAEILAVDWRDVPERQRSIRAVFEWSWRLLRDAEQRLLHQCASFRGGFDYAAAQAVIGATFPLLTRLVDKSLLQWQATTTGEGRYAMHELLRQFASEELAHEEPENREALRRRYAQYYLHWISQRTANVPVNQRALVNAELQHEMENCRQAWLLAVQERRIDLIAVGLSGFVYLWRKTGRLAEGETMLDAALQAFAATTEDTPLQHATVATLLVEQATLLYLQHKHHQAIRVALLAIQKAEVGADAVALVRASLVLSNSARFGFDLTINRIATLERALALARQHQLGRWETEALISLADEHGELAQQHALLTEALHIAQGLADPSLEISALSILSGTFEKHGQYARALPYRQRILELAEVQAEPRSLCSTLHNYALTYGFLGCYPTALVLCQQAQAKAYSYNLDLMAITMGEDIANFYWAMGEVEQAYTVIMAARRQLADDPTRTQLMDYSYARILASRGELTEAQQIVQRLLPHLRRQVGASPPHLLRCLSLLAQIYRQSGAHAAALTYTEEMLQILADHPQIDLSAVNWEIFTIYVTCYEVLQQANDPRANALLQRGYAQLQSQAAHIESPALRQSFLENIPAHRKLVAAWQSYVGGSGH